MRLAIATCTLLPELTPDDQLLADALRASGAGVELPIWDDATVDWSRFDAVVVRSVWDYHHRVEEFYAWIEQVHAVAPLVNTAEILAKNAHKGYLREFHAAGLAVVPTAWISHEAPQTLESVMQDQGWSDIILKPAVSASAMQTMRVTQANLRAGERLVTEILPRCEAMVQPCLASVREIGETPMVYFDGEFSHAVRRPSPLDHGEELNPDTPPLPPVSPSEAQHSVAASVIAALPEPPTYARVDLVDGDDGEPMLLELELIEPYLFMASHPRSAETFSAAILRRL